MARQDRGISYCNETWNPVAGCTKISAGCQGCWAERMAIVHYNEEFPNGWDGHAAYYSKRLEQPLDWKKPRIVAVAFMGDLFHPAVHDEWIEAVFATMALADRHTFLVLTKRPDRMQQWSTEPYLDALIEGAAQKIYHDRTGEDPSLWLAVHLPLPNVWLGITAEDQPSFDARWPYLRATPAALRFVSYEPALGPLEIFYAMNPEHEFIDLALNKQPRIEWVTAGCESGPKRRSSDPAWMESMRRQCVCAGVPFHLKQMEVGGHVEKAPCLAGRQWLEMPQAGARLGRAK